MQVLNEAFVDHIKVHDMQILPYQPEDGSFGIHFSLSGDNKINDWLPGELDLRRFTRTARKIISEKGLFYFFAVLVNMTSLFGLRFYNYKID